MKRNKDSYNDTHEDDLTPEDILGALSKDEDIRSEIDKEFILEELSKKLTRRQAIILRLLFIDKTKQCEISKILGFSTSTISLEVRTIKKIIRDVLDK